MTFVTLHTTPLETITDEVRLRSILDSGEVDLKMLHYHYPGFEHYDVLSLTDGVVKFAEV